jgi:DNA-directed RNA polymerase specialized sigma24 family protein
MSDVTRILAEIESGQPQAAEQLLPLVYDELRKLAAARLAQEKPGQTLQPTALVHEAYLRLVGKQGPGTRSQEPGVRNEESEKTDLAPGSCPLAPGSWPLAPVSFHSRGHFFAAAAEAMRRILVENARRKKATRHGGERQRVELDEALAVDLAAPSDEVLAVDEALSRLEERDPLAARLVKLRYFSGLTLHEAAAMLEIPPRTADRVWLYARTWLYRELQRSQPADKENS